MYMTYVLNPISSQAVSFILLFHRVFRERPSGVEYKLMVVLLKIRRTINDLSWIVGIVRTFSHYVVVFL